MFDTIKPCTLLTLNSPLHNIFVFLGLPRVRLVFGGARIREASVSSSGIVPISSPAGLTLIEYPLAQLFLDSSSPTRTSTLRLELIAVATACPKGIQSISSSSQLHVFASRSTQNKTLSFPRTDQIPGWDIEITGDELLRLGCDKSTIPVWWLTAHRKPLHKHNPNVLNQSDNRKLPCLRKCSIEWLSDVACHDIVTNPRRVWPRPVLKPDSD